MKTEIQVYRLAEVHQIIKLLIVIPTLMLILIIMMQMVLHQSLMLVPITISMAAEPGKIQMMVGTVTCVVQMM